MITPLEIENKRFSKKNFNGYDPDEVDDFFDLLIAYLLGIKIEILIPFSGLFFAEIFYLCF